jgi:hypothetical protein
VSGTLAVLNAIARAYPNWQLVKVARAIPIRIVGSGWSCSQKETLAVYRDLFDRADGHGHRELKSSLLTWTTCGGWICGTWRPCASWKARVEKRMKGTNRRGSYPGETAVFESSDGWNCLFFTSPCVPLTCRSAEGTDHVILIGESLKLADEYLTRQPGGDGQITNRKENSMKRISQCGHGRGMSRLI